MKISRLHERDRNAIHVIFSFAALLCSLLAAPAIGRAGVGELLWAKRAGGPGPESGVDVAPLGDGSALVVGMLGGQMATFGPGEEHETQLFHLGDEDRDFFFAKYHPGGDLAWAKQAVARYEIGSADVAVNQSGDAWITGHYGGAATFDPGEPSEVQPSCGGMSATFLARYKPDGTVQWVACASGSNGGRGVAVLSDDSAVVTGYFHQTIVFGLGEEHETWLESNGREDVFVARYAPDGSLMWATQAAQASDTGTAVGLGIELSPLGDGFVSAGTFSQTATFGVGQLNETQLTSFGDEDIFVAKYKVDGSLAWAKHLGGSVGKDRVNGGVAAAPDGGIVVTGYFNGTATFGPGETHEIQIQSAGEEDIFIAKYNADGSLAWARSAGGDERDLGQAIAALPDGAIVVTGSFDEAAIFGKGELHETQLVSAGESDLFYATYDSDGTLAWARRDGGSSSDAGYGIAALPDGNVVITGVFHEAATFGAGEVQETTLAGFGYDDIFVAKYETGQCLRTGDVTGDSLMTAEDAQLAFMVVLGTYEPTETERCAADCNGDGVVSAGDAQQIFAAALGMGQCVDALPQLTTLGFLRHPNLRPGRGLRTRDRPTMPKGR